mmetsp:Transcript_1101/g.1255  ORF Transcript_1101/g.1255 Transcript_1101/m.1255 type:complete len:169 (-) Transcript_1101:205-711(-)
MACCNNIDDVRKQRLLEHLRGISTTESETPGDNWVSKILIQCLEEGTQFADSPDGIVADIPTFTPFTGKGESLSGKKVHVPETTRVHMLCWHDGFTVTKVDNQLLREYHFIGSQEFLRGIYTKIMPRELMNDINGPVAMSVLDLTQHNYKRGKERAVLKIINDAAKHA